MPIPDPPFDSRTYREILDEALARIPVHTPEWTNFNDSDPGVAPPAGTSAAPEGEVKFKMAMGTN